MLHHSLSPNSYENRIIPSLAVMKEPPIFLMKTELSKFNNLLTSLGNLVTATEWLKVISQLATPSGSQEVVPSTMATCESSKNKRHLFLLLVKVSSPSHLLLPSYSKPSIKE